jgi:hypothetical protein
MPNEKKTGSVRTDHNRDRESVARKIIAKRDIITRTDRVLYEQQR